MQSSTNPRTSTLIRQRNGYTVLVVQHAITEERSDGQGYTALVAWGADPDHPSPRSDLALIMAGPYYGLDTALYPSQDEVQPSGSAVAWSAIWSGAAVAISVTLILLMIGAGLGFAAVSPWPGLGARASTFTITAGIWLIVAQWLSSMIGGYIAGRLRTRWTGLHTDEVFFRDTAHGLITWSVATIAVVGVAVLVTALSSLGVQPSPPATSPELVDQARKTAATFSIFGGLSMLIGAFVAATSAAIAGRLRDKHP